jgi:hypothetical protein
MATATSDLARAAMMGSQPSPPPPPTPSIMVNPPAAADVTTDKVKTIARSFYNSWMFKYVVLFVSIVTILLVINPPFVRHDDEHDSPCSLQNVVTIAAVVTVLAGIAPVLYDHRGMVQSILP